MLDRFRKLHEVHTVNAEDASGVLLVYARPLIVGFASLPLAKSNCNPTGSPSSSSAISYPRVRERSTKYGFRA